MEIKSLFFIENYNTGFPAYVSDVIIHLSQWQFWFWFWFSIFWILFILVIFKIFYYQNYKNIILLNTGLKSHGKWGDFLAAILPLIWCSGILINSNFILRTLEWQHENTLFTLRIHGRQWYWIFKYDMKTFLDMFNFKIRTGKKFILLSNFNKKNKNIFKEILPYYSVHYNNNIKKFFNKLKKKNSERLTQEIIVLNNHNYNFKLKNLIYFIKNNFNKININKKLNKYNNFLNKDTITNIFYINKKKKINFKKYSGIDNFENAWDVKWCLRKNIIRNYIEPSISNKFVNFNFIFLDISLNTKFFKNKKTSILFLKNFYFKYNTYVLEKNDSFFLNLHTNEISTPYHSFRNPEPKFYYILKQKRIKKLRVVKHNNLYLYKDIITKQIVNNYNYKINKIINFNYNKNLIKKSIISGNLFKFPINYLDLKNEYTLKSFLYNIIDKLNRFYGFKVKYKPTSYLLQKCKLKKKQNKRTFIFSLSLSKRLLKVKKVLLLPVATNIALVTSSYDVAHSLFIPALGLKFDAVPGRATHHTLNIIHRGVYYAQCAEICGRYHHHMPAKISVVFFEQFINWWKIKSLNIFIKLNKNILLKNFHILNYYFTRLYSY